VCAATFMWSQNSLTCVCNSTSVPGPTVSGVTRCLNCDRFVGASGVDNANSARCRCLGSSLIWDDLKKLCLCPVSTSSPFWIIAPNATCIPCNANTDPNITPGSSTVDAYNCRCADSFFWDNIRMRCVRCSTLGGTKRAGAELSCVCAAGFYFDVYTNLCVQTPSFPCDASNISSCLGCNVIQNADAATGPVALVNNAFFNGRDVSLVRAQYSSIASTLSRYAAYQCLCTGEGFFWETTRKRCQIVFA
jgi:hypothetical protein